MCFKVFTHFFCVCSNRGEGVDEKWRHVLKFHERCNTRSRAARVYFLDASSALVWNFYDALVHNTYTRCVYGEPFSHKFIKLLEEITDVSPVHNVQYTHCCHFYLHPSRNCWRKEASVSSYSRAHTFHILVLPCTQNPPSHHPLVL